MTLLDKIEYWLLNPGPGKPRAADIAYLLTPFGKVHDLYNDPNNPPGEDA